MTREMARWCFEQMLRKHGAYIGRGNRIVTLEDIRQELAGTALRRAVLKRGAFACRRCGDKPTIVLLDSVVPDIARLHVDHVVPIAAGGKTEWGNLQTLCATCNLRKGRALAVQAPLLMP